MAIKNGMWNVITMKLCPGSMGLRHFVPFVFLLSVIFLPLLSMVIKPIVIIFVVEMFLYFVLDIYFSYELADNVKSLILLLILFPLFHVTYGLGSMKGILKILFEKDFK